MTDTRVISAYTTPDLTRIAVIRHQGTDFLVKQSPKKVTTVWLANTASARITKRDHPNTFHAVVGAATDEWYGDPVAQARAEHAAPAYRTDADAAATAHEASAAYAADREQITRDAAKQARRGPSPEVVKAAVTRLQAELDAAAPAIAAILAEPLPGEEQDTSQMTPAPEPGYPVLTTDEAAAIDAEGLHLMARHGGHYSYEVRQGSWHGALLGRVTAVTESIGEGFWLHYAAYLPDGSRAGHAPTRLAAARLLRPVELTPAVVTLTNAELWR